MEKAERPHEIFHESFDEMEMGFFFISCYVDVNVFFFERL